MARQSHKPAAADNAPGRRIADTDRPWGEQHLDIVRSEIAAINTRRDKSHPVAGPDPGKVVDVVGLSLSGGGIRSSAICLGVLQALNRHDLIKRIDYLSTVAGGGYIGSSLTATMTMTGEFVFGRASVAGVGGEQSDEISDTPAVGHIRNYSNYLIPAGLRDGLTGAAIVVRGLVANLSLVLPIVLLLAAITVLTNPARSCLYNPTLFGFRAGNEVLFSFGYPWILRRFGFMLLGLAATIVVLLTGIVHRLVSGVARNDFVAYLAGIAFVVGVVCDVARDMPVDHFALTLAAALLGIILFLVWGLWRSFLRSDQMQEFRGHLPTMGATYLVLLGVIGFFDLQPFVLARMFDAAEGNASGFGIVGIASGGISYFSSIAASVAAGVALFRRQLADALKDDSAASAFTSQALAVGAKATIWFAGAAILFLIWGGFLYLSYWGIANDKVLPDLDRQFTVLGWDPAGMQPAFAKASGNISGKIQFNSETKTLSAEIGSKDEGGAVAASLVTVTSHIPRWLLSSASPFGNSSAHWAKTGFGNNVSGPIALLYIVVALALFEISWLSKPNANSLYRLYRDRLSKAFLFDPKPSASGGPIRNEASIDQGRDFPNLDLLRLSALYPEDPMGQAGERKLKAPYHLINTALNIQGSDFANRRGRSTDFFVFSPLHVGSEATGYADTAKFEQVQPGLDLATAMAVSGAAASSANRRSNSIEPLTLTLTLLNVRFGYWLKNPRYVSTTSQPQRHSAPLYIWSEIAGRLYENSDAVYLTHGGHIENLGVYELLRRRCKVIISVDAEADAPMNFPSLMALQRYAGIDLGIRIDLPWTPIRTRTLELMNSNAGKSPPSASYATATDDRVHVAIGTIDYGGGEKGYLVYIKASLTGDENDFVRDYARRNDRFPHETTDDQFFSAEQFEVYRAFGFDMTNGFLLGDDQVVAAVDGKPPVTTRFSAAGVASIDAVRAALGFPALVHPPGNPASGGSGLS